MIKEASIDYLLSRIYRLIGASINALKCKVSMHSISIPSSQTIIQHLVVEAVIVACITKTVGIPCSIRCGICVREAEEVASTRILHALRKGFVSPHLHIAD